MSIEIHLDGKPVTKLQAARALSVIDGRRLVHIGEPDEDGEIIRGRVTVYARHHAFEVLQAASVSWLAFGAVTAEDTREFLRVVALGAEIAELAEMLAAEAEADDDLPKAYVHPCTDEMTHQPCGRPELCDCDCHTEMWKALDRATPGYRQPRAETVIATPEERLVLAIYGVNPDNEGNVRELRTHAAECTEDDHTGCLAHLSEQAASAQ